MAAAAAHADNGHLIEFKALEVRSILNKSLSKRMLSLAYSINPYRGCEFGCKYCYARYTHEFMAPKIAAGEAQPSESSVSTPMDFRNPVSFERMIFLKQNAAWLLEQELKKIDPALEIALGTATDPYQPIERKAQITRSLLEVFARRTGYRLGNCDQVAVDREGHRSAGGDRAAQSACGACDDYDTGCKAGPAAGAPRAASGPALSSSETAAGGGDCGGGLRFAIAAGNYRQPASAGQPGSTCCGGGCEFFRSASAVPQAVLASYLPRLYW